MHNNNNNNNNNNTQQQQQQQQQQHKDLWHQPKIDLKFEKEIYSQKTMSLEPDIDLELPPTVEEPIDLTKSEEEPNTTTDDVTSDFDFLAQKKAFLDKGLLVKEFHGLFMACYPNKSRKEREKVDFQDPVIRTNKGVIYCKTTGRVVCKAFDKFHEHPQDFDLQTIEKFDDECTVFESLDGSLVKLYHHDGDWKVATNRCISAQRSRWSNYRSFADYFQEAKEASGLDFEKLDVSRCYAFVLCHPENRIVTNYTEPKLYHVLTWDLQNQRQVVGDDIDVQKPIKYEFKTFDDLLESLNDMEWFRQGYVVRYKSQEGPMYFKLVNPAFERVSQLRGRSKDGVYRYLELQRAAREDSDDMRCMEFIRYYPEYKWVDSQIYEIAKDIHTAYMTKYVRSFVAPPGYERPSRYYWAIMREIVNELHTLYIRTKNATTLQKVKQHLETYPLEKLVDILLFRKRKKTA